MTNPYNKEANTCTYSGARLMAYSDFTVGKVKQAFGIQTIEGSTFFPMISPVAPTSTLLEVLEENLPLAVALPSEKAKSELLISPILVEVRKLLKRQVSLFSGQDFTVNADEPHLCQGLS
ncbi:MAG: hypothetical protein DSM106950_41630 [Stigonema ocellatum SAG 48.90 = DSM 106950]|nr:hypothetical protein [Stigonema ocellatum SAG 48.90 = DSM 106950]